MTAAPSPRHAAASRAAVGGTGLTLPLTFGLPVAGYVEVARRGEALGYHRLWAAEAGTNDAIALLTACAAATSRIGLATGVVPIATRTPALMAAAAATLQDASGGRFTLGVGVSSRTVVERWNGVPYDGSLDRIREYVELVNRLLAGERVAHAGPHYHVDGYRLLMSLPEPPPVIIGALGERMLALAGEVADGACLNWIVTPAVSTAAGTVRRSGRPVKVAVFVRACVTDDVGAASAWARREVMSYVTVPAYRAAFARQGFADACEAAMARWEAGDRKGAAESLPADMIAALVLVGSAEQVRAGFEEFRAAGVDEPIAFPVTGQTEPTKALAELDATLRALAPAA